MSSLLHCDTTSQAYLRNARYCYVRWGADGKVRQLDQLYPHIREEQPAPGPTSTIDAPVEHLDLATVIKVSQAVSGEMILEKLIDGLMRAAVQQAGADRGLLIHPEGAQLLIQAEATTGGDEVSVHQQVFSENPTVFPESIIRYVMRAKQSIILEDASSPNPFSADPYIVQRRPRSILTLPLINQGKLIGILHLENNLTPHVFTRDRITVLKVLASQAAISLENTRLYRDLGQREAMIRRAEEKLRKSEAYLSEAQKLSHTGSFGWDVSSGEIYWSAETFQIFEYEPTTKIMIELVLQRVHPEDREAVEQLIERVSRESAPFEFEHRLLMPDGSVKYLQVMGRPSRTESGYLEFVGAVTDITQRRHGEKKLQRSEEYLAEAQSVTHTGSCAIDGTNRQILYWSDEMFRLFGFDPEQGLPMWEQWVERIHPEDLDKFRMAGDRTFLEKAHCDVELRIVKPDGTVRYIHAIGHPILNPRRELVQVVGSAQS